MPDDQVTIDPEFLPSPPRSAHSRWLRLGAVAAAAFLLGWLLRSPAPVEPQATPMPPTSTATSAHATTSPSQAPTQLGTTTTEASIVGLEVPLGEAIAGFADTITIALASGVWGEEVDIVRWQPSQATPETIVSFRDDFPDEWEWFVGMDAAGTWYAVQDEFNVLSVRPVGAVAEDEGWWEPTREVVGLRVASAAWHDTAPGRLAWLSCPRTPDGPGTLYTLDFADASTEPVPVTQLPDSCGGSAAWIYQWGEWGFALGWEEELVGADDTQASMMLLDPGDVKLTDLADSPVGADMVAAGPAGTIWTERPFRGSRSSFLLSIDGQRRTRVPGLADSELVEDAAWSSEGSRIGLVVYDAQADRSLVRIVEAETGEIAAEIEDLGPVVFQTCWSSDGRYLLIGHDRDEEGAAGAALVVHDTATARAIETPFREYHYFREIRTVDPASIRIQLAPVNWKISLEDETRGVYTLYTIVGARPLVPEQVEDVSGRLIWDQTVVDLCGIAIRDAGPGFVDIGDIFQTTEGCGDNPTAMQNAFDQFGLPEKACIGVTVSGVEHQYCAQLS